MPVAIFDGDEWVIVASQEGAITDHGALNGLGDDDHPQYWNDTRGANKVTLAINNHVAHADPHPTYLTKPEGDVLYKPLSAPQGHSIHNEGDPLLMRAKLDFVGGGVTASDDAINDKTLVTIPSGDEVAISGVFPGLGYELWVDTTSEGFLANESYTHNQALMATDWHVIHTMGRHPVVQAEDAVGNQITGSVTHLSINDLNIHFAVAITGKASCS